MPKKKIKLICPICGQYMITSTPRVTSNTLTKDHVFPRSISNQATAVQGICSRCNQLKRDLAPDILMYRIVAVSRFIETHIPGLRCNSIVQTSSNIKEPVWTIKFKNGIVFTIYYQSRLIKIRGENTVLIDRVFSCKLNIFKTIFEILEGPLTPNSKDIKVKKSNSKSITMRQEG